MTHRLPGAHPCPAGADCGPRVQTGQEWGHPGPQSGSLPDFPPSVCLSLVPAAPQAAHSLVLLPGSARWPQAPPLSPTVCLNSLHPEVLAGLPCRSEGHSPQWRPRGTHPPLHRHSGLSRKGGHWGRGRTHLSSTQKQAGGSAPGHMIQTCAVTPKHTATSSQASPPTHTYTHTQLHMHYGVSHAIGVLRKDSWSEVQWFCPPTLEGLGSAPSPALQLQIPTNTDTARQHQLTTGPLSPTWETCGQLPKPWLCPQALANSRGTESQGL